MFKKISSQTILLLQLQLVALLEVDLSLQICGGNISISDQLRKVVCIKLPKFGACYQQGKSICQRYIYINLK